MSRLAVCERHGLSYDADQHASCPECGKTIGGLQPAASRPSRLDTQRLDIAGKPPASTRTAATTRRPEGRTTARGPRSSRDPKKQQPQFVPVVRPSSRPPSHRLHGLLALGWLGLIGVLAYRQWWGGTSSASAVAESGTEVEAVASSAAPSSGPTATSPPARERASPAEEPASETDQRSPPARRWPPVRYRGRSGELPEICRIPWLEMYDRNRWAALGGGQLQSKTPLMVAAESGELGSLQLSLGQGAEIDARDSLNQTALMYAARRGRKAHVEALLRAGADGRTRGVWDESGGSLTALDAALLAGSADVAQLIQGQVLQSFLALGASDLSALDEAGDTPLHWVARYADARAARVLLDRGANAEAQNCPARPGDERGPHQTDLRAATPLLVAIWEENPAVARQLLEAKANARALDERGRGVFHVMRHPASLALTAELLAAGADPLLPDRDGKTALDALAASGLRAELLRALAAAGRPMQSPLATLEDLFGVLRRLGEQRDSTTSADDPAPVIALLEGDALLASESDAQGRSALFEAAAQGLPAIAETLVARGARVDARDHAGRSPLHLARDGNTVRRLVQWGARVDARDSDGITPLQLRAATPGSLDAVTALIEAGANARLVNAGKRSALDLARTSGSPDVVKYLEDQL
jgi:ankyrin repeat protein